MRPMRKLGSWWLELDAAGTPEAAALKAEVEALAPAPAPAPEGAASEGVGQRVHPTFRR